MRELKAATRRLTKLGETAAALERNEEAKQGVGAEIPDVAIPEDSPSHVSSNLSPPQPIVPPK
jgi:hypothetical protein